MTIGSLWLPSLGAPLTSLPLSQRSGAFSIASGSSPQSVPLTSFAGPTYTTLLNDCIVVAFSQGWFGGASFSGAGATWDLQQANAFYGLAVGYATSAGQTSFSITTHAATDIEIVWAAYSTIRNVSDPVAGSIGGTSGTSPVIITGTPSVGQFLFAMGGDSLPRAGTFNTDVTNGWSLIGNSRVTRNVTLQTQTAASTSVPFDGNVGSGANIGAVMDWVIPAP